MYRRVENRDESMKNFYTIIEQLGEGTFGKVWRAVSKATGEEFAIKSIDKSKLGQDEISNLQLEIDIISQVDHPNIVRTYEVFDEPRYLHFVMEIMSGGELFEKIVEKDHYSEKEAADTIRPVVEAIKYCHDMGIVHRDLKPENLLLSSADEGGILKITDFGLARFYDDDLMTTACGTPGYVAPEIIEARGYGLEVDYWSLGVILYIMLCGFPPFFEDNNEKLFDMIKKGEYEFTSPYWDDISAMAKDLISHLLQVTPSQRFNAEEVLRHPWMTGENTPRTNMPAVSRKIREFNTRRRFRKVGNAAVASVKLIHIAHEKHREEYA
ncbi:unnamed protein product [Blepharisma stoltei]|uniref:non-specific serine/threonine protein kinase n=1 Tax=Blepharisma stoltei TaxID=1481888 RepID=A0AAU9JR79_9CILI|nr:unnamed protein product [Blepharisma stoltei]